MSGDSSEQQPEVIDEANGKEEEESIEFPIDVALESVTMGEGGALQQTFAPDELIAEINAELLMWAELDDKISVMERQAIKHHLLFDHYKGQAAAFFNRLNEAHLYTDSRGATWLMRLTRYVPNDDEPEYRERVSVCQLTTILPESKANCRVYIRDQDQRTAMLALLRFMSIQCNKNDAELKALKNSRSYHVREAIYRLSQIGPSPVLFSDAMGQEWVLVFQETDNDAEEPYFQAYPVQQDACFINGDVGYG